jgi:prefoldin subunit 5
VRRRRTTRDKPSTAGDLTPSFREDLRDRLARLEGALTELQQSINAQTKRCTAIQAQLDHLLARTSPQ